MAEKKIPEATVMVIGSLHMDFIEVVKRHVRPNEHVQSERSIQITGGHGANQAVACRRLSHDKPSNDGASRRQSDAKTLVARDIKINVHMVGRVGGADDYGERIRENLLLDGVNVDQVKSIKDVRTGFARITVDRSGVSRIISSPQANEKFTPEMVPEMEPPPDMLLLQLEIPFDTVLKAREVARSKGVQVILNTAPLTVSSIEPGLYKVDHLIMNKYQASMLRHHGSEEFSTTSEFTHPLQKYAEDLNHFHREGARCVVITLAEDGAICSQIERDFGDRKRQYYAEAVPLPGRKIEDTTGASDSFIGAYAVELLRQKKNGEKEDIMKAIEMGIRAGGLTVTGMGSMDSIPWRSEILNDENFKTAPKVGRV